MEKNSDSEIVLLTDKGWSVIEEELCRILKFTPMAVVRNGDVIAIDKYTPYASVELECRKFPTSATGFITHKIDFMHLWHVFENRTIKDSEEVLIAWTRSRYKSRIHKLVSFGLPKLLVMICKKNAYDLIHDKEYRPDLFGMERARASFPIEEFVPDVMER